MAKTVAKKQKHKCKCHKKAKRKRSAWAKYISRTKNKARVRTLPCGERLKVLAKRYKKVQKKRHNTRSQAKKKIMNK